MEEKKKENEKWELKTKRFVAFLDILGFKDMVMREDIDKVYNKLLNIHKLSPEGVNLEDDLYLTIFSDTIIIFSKSDDTDSYFIFSAYVRYLALNAIGRGIPLKGAMAHGEIFVDKEKNIFLGQPLIDAYLLEEELQYMGVVLHHSMEKYISLLVEKDYDEILWIKSLKGAQEIIKTWLKNVYKEVNAPLKSGKRKHLNLDIPYMYNVCANMSPVLKDYRLTMSGATRKYVDNTEEVFAEFVRQNKIFSDELKDNDLKLIEVDTKIEPLEELYTPPEKEVPSKTTPQKDPIITTEPSQN